MFEPCDRTVLFAVVKSTLNNASNGVQLITYKKKGGTIALAVAFDIAVKGAAG
jgi:hypothetical protein